MDFPPMKDDDFDTIIDEDGAEHFPLVPIESWQQYMVRRMNRQDRMLKKIYRTILFGVVGMKLIRWVAAGFATVVALYAAYAKIK